MAAYADCEVQWDLDPGEATLSEFAHVCLIVLVSHVSVLCGLFNVQSRGEKGIAMKDMANFCPQGN